PADDHAAQRARAHGWPLRAADHVRGRRAGERHDRRAPLNPPDETGATPGRPGPDSLPRVTETAIDTVPPAGSDDAGDVLACRGLRKAYDGRLAVDGVGFTIARGETYGLIGPNGAGKTTTISIVCGLLARDAGEVTVAGRPIDPGATVAKAAIGLVRQEVALYEDLTGEENLAFFGRLQGLDRRMLAARVAEVLELVGLTDRARDRVGEYSGGMKRRANIAVG